MERSTFEHLHPDTATYRIFIEGTVQGVGFRPFIYQLAIRYGLCGTVLNDVQGVEIFINTTPETLHMFLDSVSAELPPLACIENIQTKKTAPKQFTGFQIVSSGSNGRKTVRIPPDVSICSECEAELFDPSNRRYGYPFITCTHCGVRYSIIYDLPYDRKNTSMKFFEMCEACKKEYSDPLDRRYHAQPIGCHECGPSLQLLDGTGRDISTRAAVDDAVRFLLDGKIFAVKGVGGYHLVCDATDEEAVARLRERKRRPAKPFAVMVKDMKAAKELAHIGKKEEMLLSSKERPIVLLNSICNDVLAASVAPGISRIGLFLPYTPLHLLLLHKLGRPIVATSANVTDEPICTDMKSLKKLQGVYDYVLEHNREIVNGCDDSVLMVVENRQIMLRRARGYAPASVKLPFALKKNVLAMGANQKSTVAIGFEDQAILSPHIGDLDSIGSVEYYKKNIETLERIYGFKPEVIIHDKHPNYESTKVARQLKVQNPELEIKGIQHHYAHILGVMAEKQLDGKVLGVAFDGTGYGDDGTLWGGEFLVCDYEGFERVAHLNCFKLLGGAKAVREPRRVALGMLFDLYGEEALKLQNPATQAFSLSELKIHLRAWQKSLNAPLSSSSGRLFDAVASLAGVCQVMSFEGESGMLLEELYDKSVKGHYRFGYENGKIDTLALIEEMLRECDTPEVAVSKFFHTLVEMIAAVCEQYDLPLVLSGGVFQNRVLLELVLERFPDAHVPGLFPPNDGGIALGQMVLVG